MCTTDIRAYVWWEQSENKTWQVLLEPGMRCVKSTVWYIHMDSEREREGRNTFTCTFIPTPLDKEAHKVYVYPRSRYKYPAGECSCVAFNFKSSCSAPLQIYDSDFDSDSHSLNSHILLKLLTQFTTVYNPILQSIFYQICCHLKWYGRGSIIRLFLVHSKRERATVRIWIKPVIQSSQIY